jgi:hypothetical protein
LELFDIGGVAAIKERGAGKRRIRVLARHVTSLARHEASDRRRIGK